MVVSPQNGYRIKPTSNQKGKDKGRRPFALLDHPKADVKYRKNKSPYKALNIAFLPVIADTVRRLRMRCACSIMRPLSRHLATSTTRPSEGLIGREREDHRFGFRRATIFRHHQAELGLLLAALGAQQRRHPKHFSFAIP